jgi:hypothetical protein
MFKIENRTVNGRPNFLTDEQQEQVMDYIRNNTRDYTFRNP